jgi:hypothetical protein
MYENRVISYLLRCVKADMAANVLHIMLNTETVFSRRTCLINLYIICCRSQWLRGLRFESGASRLLGLRVRVPPVSCSSVCGECCVLSGRGLCDGPITRPTASYRVWWV